MNIIQQILSTICCISVYEIPKGNPCIPLHAALQQRRLKKSQLKHRNIKKEAF